MIRRLCVVLTMLACVSITTAEAAKPTFHLQREDILLSDHTAVVRLTITSSAFTPGQRSSKLEFRWRPLFSHAIAEGLWKQTGKEISGEILIVAQLADGTKDHPPLLTLTTQQTSQSAAQSFDAIPLAANAKLTDLLPIDAKTGDYPLDEPLNIATLRGEPVTLSLPSMPKE